MVGVAVHHVLNGAIASGAFSPGRRAVWSRPISARADSKLAPCMARPNLFSGD